MTSRRHYVRKADALLHKSPRNLVRGINVAERDMTQDQIAFRRTHQSLLLRFAQKDARRDRELEHILRREFNPDTWQ